MTCDYTAIGVMVLTYTFLHDIDIYSDSFGSGNKEESKVGVDDGSSASPSKVTEQPPPTSPTTISKEEKENEEPAEKEKEKEKEKPIEDGATPSLYIGNLTWWTSDDDLSALIKQHGKYVSI